MSDDYFFNVAKEQLVLVFYIHGLNVLGQKAKELERYIVIKSIGYEPYWEE